MNHDPFVSAGAQHALAVYGGDAWPRRLRVWLAPGRDDSTWCHANLAALNRANSFVVLATAQAPQAVCTLVREARHAPPRGNTADIWRLQVGDTAFRLSRDEASRVYRYLGIDPAALLDELDQGEE